MLLIVDGMKSSLVENFTWNEKMTIPVLNTETKNLEVNKTVFEHLYKLVDFFN